MPAADKHCALCSLQVFEGDSQADAAGVYRRAHIANFHGKPEVPPDGDTTVAPIMMPRMVNAVNPAVPEVSIRRVLGASECLLQQRRRYMHQACLACEIQQAENPSLLLPCTLTVPSDAAPSCSPVCDCAELWTGRRELCRWRHECQTGWQVPSWTCLPTQRTAFLAVPPPSSRPPAPIAIPACCWRRRKRRNGRGKQRHASAMWRLGSAKPTSGMQCPAVAAAAAIKAVRHHGRRSLPAAPDKVVLGTLTHESEAATPEDDTILRWYRHDVIPSHCLVGHHFLEKLTSLPIT